MNQYEYHEPKYYSNHFNSKNAGNRIYDINKLYEGQNYLLTYNNNDFSSNSWGKDECGPLSKKTFSGRLDSTEMAYYGIYVRIGTAKYDGLNMKDQIHEYHWQRQCTLADMRIEVYEYRLDLNLQTQIKWCKYYKKTVKNLCSELGICEDVEKIICKYII
jgi:hypothetical protein